MTAQAILSNGSRGTMVDEAYRVLRHKIIFSEIPPGYQALEDDLAATLGMSRTPLREALIRLENEGFVEIIPRRGMRVKPLTVRDIHEVGDLLACLECEAAEKLAQRKLSPEEMKRLESAIADMDKALDDDDMNAWAEADYRFHVALVDMCGNQHLADVAQNFLDKAHRFRLLALPHREKPVYSNVNHAAVVEAIRRGDSQTALEIHRSHKRRWGRELNEILELINISGMPEFGR